SATAPLSSADTPSLTILPERWISAWIQHVPIDEEVRELRAHGSKFRMAIKRMGNAFEGVKFYRNVHVAKLLHQTLAALDRDRDVLHAVENCSRRKASGEVCRRCRSTPCRVVAAGRKHTRRDIRSRIVGQTDGDL